MKIKHLIFFALVGIIFPGLTSIGFNSVLDKGKTIRLLDQNQVNLPESFTVASMTKETILLLLAVGVMGVLGVSRKKKNKGDCMPQNETTRRRYSSDPKE